MTVKTIALSLAASCLFTCAVAHSHDPSEQEDPKRGDAAASEWELSFGTSQLFSSGFLEDDQQGETLPTTSALFISEYFFSKRWGFVALFNLPLTPERTLRNGEVISRFAAPTLAAGLEWTPLSWDVREASRLEVQFALMGGAVLAPSGRFFPLSALRLHLLQNEGFALYVGTAFAFRLDTLALIYGIGHRF